MKSHSPSEPSDFFVCTRCNSAYPARELPGACACGGTLSLRRKPDAIALKAALDKQSLREVLRYLGRGYIDGLPAIPLANTPVFEDEKQAGCFYKFEGALPSGSYKDRGAALMLAVLKTAGIQNLVEDSSGNAGAAIAMCAAAMQIDCTIVCPDSASGTKLNLIRKMGAKLNLVPGAREEATRRAGELVRHAFYASHVHCPWFIEGVKSLAYEIAFQFGFKIPDRIVLPLGNGSLLLGLHYGFEDLMKAGFIGKHPRLVAVQAALCAPVYAAFHSLAFERKGSTVAEGIANAEVARLHELVAVLHACKGSVLLAGEAEIHQAHEAAFARGWCIEPTSSVVLTPAASAHEQGETILFVLSGSGLKTL